MSTSRVQLNLFETALQLDWSPERAMKVAGIKPGAMPRKVQRPEVRAPQTQETKAQEAKPKRGRRMPVRLPPVDSIPPEIPDIYRGRKY